MGFKNIKVPEEILEADRQALKRKRNKGWAANKAKGTAEKASSVAAPKKKRW